MTLFDLTTVFTSCIGFFSFLAFIWFTFVYPKGLSYWWCYFTALFHSYNNKPCKQLSDYKILAKKQVPSVTELGFIPSAKEYELEYPQEKPNPETSDGIHFFGVDEQGNCLEVCVNKIDASQATVWLILKLNDNVYKLPLHPDTRCMYRENDRGFSAPGIQITCLSPLRKWRIAFNGLLRKCEKEIGSDSSLVHVKFSFIWFAMTIVHELNAEYDVCELSKAFAAEQKMVNKQTVLDVQKILHCYEQWGQLMGTIKFEEQSEHELYLWSIRSRLLDKQLWSRNVSFVKLYMYFKDGIPAKIEALSVEGLFSNFINGYYITAGGKKKSITDCNLRIERFHKKDMPSSFFILFKKDGQQHFLTVNFLELNTKVLTGPMHERELNLQLVKIKMDDEEGYGIIHLGYKSNVRQVEPLQKPIVILRDKGYHPKENTLILSLNDELCQSSLVSGGKGCSLSLLTLLSKHSDKFAVPAGLVVTTAAFQNHLKINTNLSDIIKKLSDVSCGRINGNLQEQCKTCVEEFCLTPLSENLKSEIKAQMLKQFTNLDSTKFAVRSSACGEDSEDFSAAGQMLTLLGVKGLNNIYEAVVKCWSSHFRYEAVQYARQNGQPIDSLMAVVIQEMVPADVAGVMFTVDPVTGNPTSPYVTASFGLGEVVVSSTVEPDTFILKRNQNGSASVIEQKVGSKAVKIVMKDEGSVEQKELHNESELLCLTEDWVERIGTIGLMVEKHYNCPLDIEWAIYDNKLYLLQARPITTIFNETDFELIHDQDTPTRSVSEYWTRANTGEVFIGATTPLGISIVVKGMDVYGQRNTVFRQKLGGIEYNPYYCHWLPVSHRQVMLSIIDTLFRANEKKLSATQRSFEVSLFGRVVEGTEEMHGIGVKKYGTVSRYQKMIGLSRMALLNFTVSRLLKDASEKIHGFSVPLENYTSSHEVYDSICQQMDFYGMHSSIHGLATYLSSVYNVFMLSILAKGKNEWDSELYCDFATLLSTCTEVESADIPSSLQELAQSIFETDAMTFASVPPEVAYNLLINDKGVAGKKFHDFLQKHGHRCVKEFDVYCKSWGMEPQSLVKVLQNIVKSAEKIHSKRKEVTSVNDAIKKLKTPLSTIVKYSLKFLLPRSRVAVGQREKTKSMIIKIVDWLRKSCYCLGKLLVLEGLLPDDELIFFLTFDEIKELMDRKTPGLVSKAIRRRRLHPKLDAVKFPEIMVGIPRPLTEEEEDISQIPSSFQLKGTPVCQGIVKARARVVTKLEEAANIQSGDILVTHSTDIGWSPYFPLLSGVVTVLGGLISHGAVIAREYGLPCVVGVQKATSLLKSGDLIILDGTKGVITKVDENEKSNNSHS